MRRVFSTILALMIVSLVAWADDVKFTAVAPSSVAKNAQFRVVYSVNADVDNMQIGDMSDFEILMGPSVSQSSSFQFINGKSQSSKNISYTYILCGTKEGTFTIPAATVVSGGKKYRSNPLVIKVLPEDKTTLTQQSQTTATTSNNDASSHEYRSENLTGVNAFVRVIPSKTKVYEQEAFVLTFKLYVKGMNLVGMSTIKFPETKGFYSQEVQLPDDKQWTLEHYDGANYNTVILKQTVLFPQQSGDITIPAGKYEAILRVSNARKAHRSIFDDFFDTYSDVKKELKSSAVTIHVKPLPSPKPDAYANAVGNFSIKSSINETEVKEHEPITVKITISGSGNMKLVKNPEIKFPADFEVYDPNITNDFKTTNTGVSGTRTIEYLAIPRHAGKFTIPSTNFVYFDPKSGSYKTLPTNSFNINVEKGEASALDIVSPTGNGTFTNKEDVVLLGEDIRYIHTTDKTLLPRNQFFVETTEFKIYYILLILLAITTYLVGRKYVKENENQELYRNKKANKFAKKRLKVAENAMKNEDFGTFYDETLKAFWGYFSDKLNIPIADLTKDSVESALQQKGVGDSIIAEVKDILSVCEFARYSPNKTKGEMENIYSRTIDSIGEIENSFKK